MRNDGSLRWHETIIIRKTARGTSFEITHITEDIAGGLFLGEILNLTFFSPSNGRLKKHDVKSSRNDTKVLF